MEINSLRCWTLWRTSWKTSTKVWVSTFQKKKPEPHELDGCHVGLLKSPKLDGLQQIIRVNVFRGGKMIAEENRIAGLLSSPGDFASAA
jgi:hypothetical protein